MAETGTPFGFSNSLERQGQFAVGAVKRLFGCASLLPSAMYSGPFTCAPFHSSALTGGFLSRLSHQTVLSSRLRATFVKIVPFFVEISAFGFDFMFVPGATPKKPFSGLIAYSLPSSPGRIHAMSSPTVQTL